jgi:flagellar L-ring protein precursor FlgH
MTRTAFARPRIALLACAAAFLLSACSAAERIGDIGEEPGLTPIQNPVERSDYTPVRMPMPAPQVVEQNANSLWQSGSRAFFRDQRANNVGDILTVLIEINDEAQLNNSSERSRTNAEGAAIPNFLGLEDAPLSGVLPDAFDPEAAIDLNSNSTSQGEGAIRRAEEITLRLAAVVTEVLPNGNLAIFGRQEVQVNFERRDLVVAGVIRPEDITSGNTINYEQIAEARVSYGGRGQITDFQQPRYGQQLYDIFFPF